MLGASDQGCAVPYGKWLENMGREIPPAFLPKREAQPATAHTPVQEEQDVSKPTKGAKRRARRKMNQRASLAAQLPVNAGDTFTFAPGSAPSVVAESGVLFMISIIDASDAQLEDMMRMMREPERC